MSRNGAIDTGELTMTNFTNVNINNGDAITGGASSITPDIHPIEARKIAFVAHDLNDSYDNNVFANVSKSGINTSDLVEDIDKRQSSDNNTGNNSGNNLVVPAITANIAVATESEGESENESENQSQLAEQESEHV